MAGTTQTDERHLLPAGTLPSDISQPEPRPDVVAERTVELTVRFSIRQEFETNSDEEAIETAKKDLHVALTDEEPEIQAVAFLDEQVTSRREETY